jgi:DNA-binding transcriptional MerR regulator/methylmalonyl-CoA mutase cobalamin-binding subunit
MEEGLMEEQEGKYNIKAASKILGIQPGTLRAWERRYRMVAPIRNESGHRLYTEDHIRILKWLSKKVALGFTISQAVSLLENNQNFAEMIPLNEGNQVAKFSNELLGSLLNFNEVKSQEIINAVFGMFTTEKVINDIFEPLLSEIGNQWEAGKITSAQERFATVLLESRIRMIFFSLPQNNFLPKVITVCSPGERHEMGLLLFSLYMRRKGFEVIHLGAGITEMDIMAALQTIQPDLLFLSCTIHENLTSVLSIVTEIALNNQKLRIGIGGKAVNTMKPAEKEQFSGLIVGQTQKDWEQWLPKR